MDRTTLVSEQRADAQRLIEKLVDVGFDLRAVAWIKTSGAGKWVLYIASQVVDDQGYFAAYLAVQTTIRNMSDLAVGPFDVQLVSASHPLVTDVQKLYQRFPELRQMEFSGPELGKMSIEDAYIYPPVPPPTNEKKRARRKSASRKRVVKAER